MNYSIKVTHLAIAIVIISGGFLVYRFDGFESVKGLFESQPKKIVNQALIAMRDNTTPDLESFSVDYLAKFSLRQYYKVDEWTLEANADENRKDAFIVKVNGKARNGFGAELTRNILFLVIKHDGRYIIADSEGLFYFKDTLWPDNRLSDLDKVKIVADSRDKCKIETWSWKQSYGDAVQGEGVIFNGGSIPQEYVKVRITYSNDRGDVINTDESYAISSALRPGERDTFTWYTTNCSSCKKASLELIFD